MSLASNLRRIDPTLPYSSLLPTCPAVQFSSRTVLSSRLASEALTREESKFFKKEQPTALTLLARVFPDTWNLGAVFGVFSCLELSSQRVRQPSVTNDSTQDDNDLSDKELNLGQFFVSHLR